MKVNDQSRKLLYLVTLKTSNVISSSIYKIQLLCYDMNTNLIVVGFSSLQNGRILNRLK
jgi:hypothetical protein